jgi:monofunctional biosynthetic peptidoglycan transglycosylase
MSSEAARRDRPRPLRLLRRLVGLVVLVALVPFALVPLYTTVDPPSTLMLARRLAAEPVVREWRPLDRISPELVRTVIASEDARFCLHHGVDWDALRDVLDNDDGPSRGASTITMQIVKNLFLWPGGGYLRKPIEIVLALWADLVWSKRRTVELYLNVAEWGPGGTFGAEAGARRAFGKSAASLTRAQAALMAVALPNPILRDPKRPSRAQRIRAARIASRAAKGGADLGCLRR